MVSIVVPVYNEKANIGELLATINAALNPKYKTHSVITLYEIIIIDDHSTDGTWELAQSLQEKFPIKLFKKVGQKGKAFSLIEGFEKACGDSLVMIDADLQYPPQIIPAMIQELKNHDVVIANRKVYKDSPVRRFLSRGFRTIFGKLFFGLDADVQSGLKAFKKQVYQTAKFTPTSSWTFDLQFLTRAKYAGFTIGGVDFTFKGRRNGSSKMPLLKTVWEMALDAISLKLKRKQPLAIPPAAPSSMLGAGVGYRQKQYITHTTLHHSQSAIKTVTFWQKTLIFSIALVLLSLFLTDAKSTAIALVGLLTAIYFADVLFNAYLIFRSLNKSPDISFSDNQLKAIDDSRLPLYTVLCPLYKEARVLRQFAQGVEDLDWPKDKLEVLLLLEEDDKETQDAARFLNLPSYFKTVIVPPSNPKTKPKACNWGLNHAHGKYIVIYDAEDKPEPLQLKRAYLAFEKFGDKIACFQAKLNYYNTHHNLLTKFFTAEYSLWFGLILTGLQSIGTTIPLGGTSNHFKTATLKKLQGWDPFNVTEDCDLGVRLFKEGYKTAIIDSITLEEANSKVGNWLRQRSRWIKGYLQTYLVHSRDLPKFVKNHKAHAAIFQLVVGGKIAFIMINPIMWLTTVAYFALRSTIGPTVEQFFPGAIFYMAAFCLIAGNFLYLYYYMVALVKQERFGLVKYILFVPVYWAMISTAFWIAAYQLIFKPHFWEKTVHGFHLAKAKSDLAKIEKEQLQAEINAQKVQARAARIQKIRELITSGTAAGGILIAATIVTHFLNFLYNAYLSRKVSVEEFGLVTLLGSFLVLSAIPLHALSKTVTHRSAFLLGKYKTPLKDFWRKMHRFSLPIGIALTILWLAVSPILADYFKVETLLPVILFAPVWAAGLIYAVDRGFLSGNLKFSIIAIVIITEAITKLALTWLLVNLGLTQWIYAALPASIMVAAVLSWFAASILKEQRDKPSGVKIDNSFPKRFYSTSVLIGVSTFAFLNVDILLAKHYLSATQAGNYALLSLAGKMIFFVGGLFSQFVMPLVSRAEGADENSKAIFYKLLLATTAVSLLGFVGVGLFGHITIPLLLGPKVAPIISLLPIYTLAMVCFTIASSIVNYHQARKQYLLSIAGGFLVIGQVLAIIKYHQDIRSITGVMLATGLGYLISMVTLHITYRYLIVIGRNLSALFGIFAKIPTSAPNKNRLRILVFNWRDTKHVWAGGAEVYVHEIAKRLVKKGHYVTVFCGNDAKSPTEETIDGVQIVRRGGFYTVYIWAFFYYVLRFRGKFDVIIDSENGIPFFTPLYVRKPVVGLVHHVHQEVFRTKLRFPLAQIGKFLEGKVMPIVYRNVEMVTVSESSREALEQIGFGRKNPVEIIHPGVDLSQLQPGSKTKNPSILYLGRLKPYKSIETAINIMPQVIGKVPKASLTIAGVGESRKSLEELVKKLHLENAVKFLGRVSEETKARLLSRSWVMVQPSMVEGWGITAIEANAAGTTVVASDVPGLRDSVQNPHSGLLVTWDNQEKWTNAIVGILTDKKQRNSLEEYAKNWAKNFTWTKSTGQFLKVIQKERYEK